ncbi:MAG: patatin-like phospholipase family protein [Candidatus Saccharibacteria bacterium]
MTRPNHNQNNRALVLGGGGSLGNAWLIGVVAGLYEAGLDVTQSDLIIGTSAGSTATAQITAASPSQLFSDILTAVIPQRPSAPASDHRPVPANAVANQMDRTAAIIAAASDLADMRRKMGAAAIEIAAAAPDSVQAQWRTTVASRLPSQSWPEQLIQIVAVDARTGESVVFDHASGVELADAVAASCASGPAYNIGDNQYIDGGYRTNAENADLAAGYSRVLILSPFGGRTRTPEEWGTHLVNQIDELRAHGGAVETIFPDKNSLEAFGDNMMDLSRRPLAAQAGYDQGKALAEKLAKFWS